MQDNETPIVTGGRIRAADVLLWWAMFSIRAIPPTFAALLCAAATPACASAQATASIVRGEFIAAAPPTPSAHASTIVETQDGFLASWFGGTREGAPDVGIWMSRDVGGRGEWSTPLEVVSSRQPDGTRVPCYNPVLFHSADGVLHLFYKVGPHPTRWWGMHMSSTDDGRTWSAPQRLPNGILGPIKNHPVVLPNGTIIAGSSTESTDAISAWRVHFEISRDDARTWTRVDPPPSEIQAIQPSILTHADGRLQAIGRTRSMRVFDTWSSDGGLTWSPLALTALPNPNAGIDAVTLRDGRQLIVYNASVTSRTPLVIAISDDGRVWHPVLELEAEPGEYSYPAVIQSGDGLVHVTYTWRRERIRHVVVQLHD